MHTEYDEPSHPNSDTGYAAGLLMIFVVLVALVAGAIAVSEYQEVQALRIEARG